MWPFFCVLLVRLAVRLLVRGLVRLRFAYVRKSLYLLGFCWFVWWFMGWFAFWFARCQQPLFLRLAIASRSCAGQFPEIPETGVNSRFFGPRRSQPDRIQAAGKGWPDQQVNNACKFCLLPLNVSFLPFSLLSPIPPINLYPFISLLIPILEIILLY